MLSSLGGAELTRVAPVQLMLTYLPPSEWWNGCGSGPGVIPSHSVMSARMTTLIVTTSPGSYCTGDAVTVPSSWGTIGPLSGTLQLVWTAE